MAQQARRTKEQSPPPPAPTPPAVEASAPAAGHRLTRRGVLILTAVLLVLNVPVIHRFLLRGAPEAHVSLPYRDDFSLPPPSATTTSPPAASGAWSRGSCSPRA